MKHLRWPVLLALPAVMLACSLNRSTAREEERPKPPPLSLEGLLDEKLPEAPKEVIKMKADNEACYVCHANYMEEALVVVHGLKGIGCVKCHGQSVDHRNDEDNVTPPDKMFTLEQVDRRCGKCHKEHDAPAQKVIARWLKRCPEKKNVDKIACTDCHFQHRLPFRTVEWNKETGELLIRKTSSQEGK